MKTYAEKLKDPRWQRKRLEIMERDGFACARCGDSKSMLSVHHLYYVSGRMPWEYPNFALVTTCDECHKFEHADTSIRDWEFHLNEIVGGKMSEGEVVDLWRISLSLKPELQPK